ncbi:MAG: glycosyltransferase, partial [Vicingaceae bacterium]
MDSVISKPKVSVIVPIYNVEKYLRRCLDSLVNQTLTDIEIILVDDDSPDNSNEIYKEYIANDNRIRLVKKKNGGLGFARNSGLEISTGEFIA